MMAWGAVDRVIAQGPRTYYVDATGGDDAHDGLSPGTAWRTMDKVNHTHFRPGDRILFKRGEIWYDTLEVNSSGQPGNPITFGAYGDGPRPVIDGQFRLSRAVQIYDQSFVVIESLELRNCTGSGLWTGGQISDLTFRDLNVHHNDSNGIFLDHANNVIIENCEIHDQSGLTDPSLLGAGIDVLGGTGILEIRYCQIYNNATHGIYHETPGAHIHHNTIYGNGVGNASFAQHGIYSNANNTIVEYNEIFDNYTTGISMRESGGICQYNTCYNNGFAQIHYSQPDEQVDISDTEFRFNVCWTTRDTSYGFSGTNMNGVRLFNNTFYCDTPGWTAAVEIPENCRSVTLKNNILYVTHQWAVSLFVVSGAQGVVEDYNLLQREDRRSDDAHVNWQGGLYTLAEYQHLSGQGAHSMEGDPRFVDPQLRDFSLRPDSPCIDAGIDVGLPYQGNAPDIGGIESDLASPPDPSEPDLVIQALTVSPSAAFPGDSVTVSFTVANIGEGTAPSSWVRVVFSPDADVTADDVSLTNLVIEELPSQGSQSFTTSVNIPTQAAPGIAFIGVIADVTGSVQEADEGNNTASAPLTINNDSSITVVTPNGGEVWGMGEVVTITWESVGLGDGLKIELSRDGGQTYETLYANTDNDGVQEWWVNGEPTTAAVIRISSNEDPSVVDTSDGVFSIVETSPPPPPPPSEASITVVTPNGGETWLIGHLQTIRWTSTGITGNVRIKLLYRDGRRSRILFRSVPNTGSVQWMVKGPASSQCQIEIISLEDRTVRDRSDGSFTIARSP